MAELRFVAEFEALDGQLMPTIQGLGQHEPSKGLIHAISSFYEQISTNTAACGQSFAAQAAVM